MTLSKAAQAEIHRRRSEAAAAQADAQETTEPEPESVCEAPEFAPVFAGAVDESREDAEVSSRIPAEPSTEKDLTEYVTLNGPASYGPVRLGGRLTRIAGGRPVRVTDPKERAALLAIDYFRPVKPRDFAAPYSGPIDTNQLRGGGLRDPEQI